MPNNRHPARPRQLLDFPAPVLTAVAVLALAGGSVWAPSAWLHLLP